jgi:uncharacterized membrane protein YadS
MNVNSALSTGKGFLLTVASILSTLLLGYEWLKIDSKTSHLITCGTAIWSVVPLLRYTSHSIR